MLIFKWSHDLDTGIPLVDRQHREIIEAANRFFIRCKCGKDKAAVKDCLAFLQQYILYHFQTEEAFQLDCSYPSYKAHSAHHLAIATQVKFFTVRIESSDYAPQVINEFYKFLTDWIKSHIYKEDLDFTHYYQQHQRNAQVPIPSTPDDKDA